MMAKHAKTSGKRSRGSQRLAMRSVQRELKRLAADVESLRAKLAEIQLAPQTQAQNSDRSANKNVLEVWERWGEGVETDPSLAYIQAVCRGLTG